MNITSFILIASCFLFGFADQPKFDEQIIDSNIAIGYGLAIGDVDGDHKPDILLADKKQFVWYRNGDWKRFVMIDNLTESDNVCIAARDIDGDGKVEVAVGAQWNPGETSDTLKSGSVHFLIRPKDPTQKWTAHELHHEPTIHRMKWVKAEKGRYQLIVLPLHGRGNKGGEGKPVKVFAYEISGNGEWKSQLLDESMHLTHNLEVVDNGSGEVVYVGGKEGIKAFSFKQGRWTPSPAGEWFVQGKSFGEVRAGGLKTNRTWMAAVEPMHGNELTWYPKNNVSTRTVLTSDLNQGHALAVADLTGSGNDQIVVGWREPNGEKKTGIRIYTQQNSGTWIPFVLDDNGIACEDLQVADLDGDGKKDIIAAGRATHNLKVYWNKNGK